MAQTDNGILTITKFSDLTRWSANKAMVAGKSDRYLRVPLSRVLTRVKEPIFIEDDVHYKRITVRLYGQGVTQRDNVLGKEIGTKRQFIAHAGQLIVSRIDARNGAFGIVPNELEGAIVTNDFWLFDVHDALPEYLILVLSSTKFQLYWQTKSSGTTNRQRVNEDGFLQSQIALPSTIEQGTLVHKHDELVRQSACIKQSIKEQEEEFNRLFYNMLQIVKPQLQENAKSIIDLVSLKGMMRWDVWNNDTEYTSVIYPRVPFGHLVVGRPMYGANEKAQKEQGDIRYIRITDINDDGSLKKESVSAKNTNPKYLLSENDFLLARSGSVGRALLYKESMGKAIFAGYLIKYNLNTQIVNPEYMLYYTQTVLFKKWIKANQHISAQPNINGQEFLSAPVILPPMEIQERIVDLAKGIRAKIFLLVEQADILEEQAKKEFEMAIFG